MRKNETVFISPEPGGDVKSARSIGAMSVNGALAQALVSEFGRDSQSRIANQTKIERSSDELEGRRLSLSDLNVT